MFLGAKIRELRLKARLSQEDLARRAGVSYQTIWRLENGETRRPHLETLERIAEALGEDQDFFRPWCLVRPKGWYTRGMVNA